MQGKIVVGGIRALGIINSHITLPLMCMLDEHESSVMDTDKYYTCLTENVRKWMTDPKDLLDDTAVLFNDFPRPKNDIHKSLYGQVDEEVQYSLIVNSQLPLYLIGSW